MSQLRSLSALVRPAAAAFSAVPLRAARAALPCPCPALPARMFHASAARRAGAGKNDDDLMDLFEEELDISGSAQPAAAQQQAGDMASLLASTRQQAARPKSSSATAAQQAAYEASAHLLDKLNPPRLEPKHYEQLRSLHASLKAKLDKQVADAKAAALAQGLPEGDALWSLRQDPAHQSLQSDEAWVGQLCRQLFPPEQVLDDRKVGELLDYAEAMPGVMHLVQPDTVDPLKLMSLNTKTTRQNRHMFCLFCKPSSAILPKNKLEYTNLNLLVSFLNERGMILQRDETRLCMKHQRQVARTVKRARSIGLLSPVSNWRVPHEFVYGRDGAAGAGGMGGASSQDRADISAGGGAAARAQRKVADFDAQAVEQLKREEEEFTGRH